MLYCIKPADKKSITYRVLIVNGDGDTVEINESYSRGQGFIDEEDWHEDYRNAEELTTNPYDGPGCDLDDAVAISITYNGEDADNEMYDMWSGEGLNAFVDSNWQVEDEEVIITGPYEITTVEEAS